nr:unnamed protein product [Callosobruchus analis]
MKLEKDDDPEFEINNVKIQASDDEDYLPLTSVKNKIKRTRKTKVKDPESKERRGRKPKHKEEEYMKTFDNLNVPVKPLVCDECTKVFETHLDYAMHSKIHSKDDLYFCHLCEYKNEDKTLFRNHMITHDIYKCKECHKIFDNKRSTFKHSKIHTSQSFVPCEF